MQKQIIVISPVTRSIHLRNICHDKDGINTHNIRATFKHKALHSVAHWPLVCQRVLQKNLHTDFFEQTLENQGCNKVDLRIKTYAVSVAPSMLIIELNQQIIKAISII